MANKHIELCLRSLRKCKLKHNDISLHAYSMDKARNNTDNIKWCQRCGAIGSFIHCWWEFQVAQPLWKILLQFLLILNMQPNTWVCGHLSQEKKNLWSHKNLYMHVCRCFIFNNSKLEKTQMSSWKWMVKQVVVYPYCGTLLSNKKEQTINLTTLMNSRWWCWLKKANVKRSQPIIPFI